MSQETKARTQGAVAPVQTGQDAVDSPEEASKARELFLGKVRITDGKALNFCQWTVVSGEGRWTYSAIMPLSSGSNHHIVMGRAYNGSFLREAHSDTKEAAILAVREQIMAFLKRQPRWRVIE